MCLNKKLPFRLDLNEMGYTKLKDLINDMQEAIKLELKGHNHPMAYLVHKGKYVHGPHKSDSVLFVARSVPLFSRASKYSQDQRSKNFVLGDENMQEHLLTAFYMLMKEFSHGILLSELQDRLSTKMQLHISF